MIDAVGFVTSTITVTSVVAELPARSTARRRKVWLPSDRPLNGYEVVPAAKEVAAPPSTLTSRWSIPEVASEAVHVSMTEFVPKI